ncbi:hypothetical protein ACJIZ3_007336 [Penstemon smallii]|uniref:Uncharacterized protein n=1 Tax=Penstemon smallii TaxID=265156 RepID=A0ABD3SAG8_9LAMI
MSSPSHPQISINQETPDQNQPDPPKPDPETLPPHNPEEKGEEEEEVEEQEQKTRAFSSGMFPPITEAHVSVTDLTTAPQPGVSKRKKGKGKGKPNFKKKQIFGKKLQSLLEKLNPIPFQPHKIFDFAKHENLLRKLGLWDFVNINFDKNLRKDLIAQLIVTYESRYSYVNGFRIGVNRAELARAFKMPAKRGSTGGGVQMDLLLEELSEDSIGFIEGFVSDWVLRHEDTWIMPKEVMDWLKVIKNGHPEKVDWAGLIWFMIEKELTKGDELEDCYYASHLQHLMREQHVFSREEEEAKMVEVDLEAKEIEVEEEDVNDTEVNVNSAVEGRGDVFSREEENLMEVDMEEKEVEEEDVNDGDVNVNTVVEGRGEENDVIESPSMKLTLGQNCEKEEGVKDEDIMDVAKCKESDAEQMGWLLDGKNVNGEHFMRPCSVENGGGLEETKVKEEYMEMEGNKEESREGGVDLEAKEVEEEEDVNHRDVNANSDVIECPTIELTLEQDGEKEGLKDEEIMDIEKCKESDEEQMKWLLNGENVKEEHFMRSCSVGNGGGLEGTIVKEEEMEMKENEEESREGKKFHLFPNDDALDQGEGLTGNFLEAMEENPTAFTSHDEEPSSMDINQMDTSIPSFFNQKGKRVIEHDNLNGSNKSLRINSSWEEEHKPVDFETCLEDIQQKAERARILLEETDQALEQTNMNQQYLLSELQKRDNVIDHLHKARFEEIQKKDGEIYRYEHELYLMGSVLDGYRKALKDTQKAFNEYRERAKLLEKPAYKDAGPGGLMLSSGEIEKLKKKEEEEYRMYCSIAAQKIKEAEEEYVVQFDGYFEKINMLDKKLTGLEAGTKELIGLYGKQKMAQIDGKMDEVEEPIICSEDEPSNFEKELYEMFCGLNFMGLLFVDKFTNLKFDIFWLVLLTEIQCPSFAFQTFGNAVNSSQLCNS